MALPCWERGRFDTFLCLNMGKLFKIVIKTVSVQVILPAGRTDEAVEKIRRIFDEDRGSTISVIAVRLRVSCGTYFLILRKDVDIGGSARSLCHGLPCWSDLAACVCIFLFIWGNAIGATRWSFPGCPCNSGTIADHPAPASKESD